MPGGWGVAFQTCNDLVQVWHWQDPAGFECTYSLDFGMPNNLYLAPDGLTFVIVFLSSCHPRDHDLLPLSTVIHGITTLPSLILSTLTIKCISVGHLCSHLTGNYPHVGPPMTPMSESGTHELASSFPSFQCPSRMTLPSHLLPLTIPSPTDSLLLCSNLRTQFASLMSITVICMVKFWVKKMQI